MKTNLFANVKSLEELEHKAESFRVAIRDIREGERGMNAYERDNYHMQHIERIEELLAADLALWQRCQALGGRKLFPSQMAMKARKLAAVKLNRKHKTERSRLTFLLN